VSGMTITTPREFRRWPVWLPILTLFAAAIAVLVWLLGVRSAPGFIEYPMLVKTDIPTAVDVTPNGAVWFTIEFSDAIGVFRNGKIERIRKESENLEPLGLAADGEGGAWYTDTPKRAISRISPAGGIRSFPLSTPIVRLGRLAVAADGAVWFADVTTRNSGLGDIVVDRSGAVWFVELRANKIGRFAEGRFTEFTIPTPSAGLTAIAAAPDGSVWFTELSVGKLGRLRDGRVTEFRLPRADSRPFGLAVDATNDVWYTDLSGWLGMLPAVRAKAP
jgi:virginiamycin B lyase